MKSTQAWGWLAAGVLAAGLNAAYHDGGFAWAHRIADRAQHVSGAVVALACGHADRFLAEAQTLTAQNDDRATAFSDSMVAKADQGMARAEVAYARAEAISAREQAHVARMEAEHTRIEDRIAARHACVHMATTRMRSAAWSMSMQIPRVNIPETSVPRTAVPQVKPGTACRRIHTSVPDVPRVNLPQVNIPGVVSMGRQSTPDSESLFSTE